MGHNNLKPGRQQAAERLFVRLHRMNSLCKNNGPVQFGADDFGDGVVVRCVECGHVESLSGMELAVEENSWVEACKVPMVAAPNMPHFQMRTGDVAIEKIELESEDLDRFGHSLVDKFNAHTHNTGKTASAPPAHDWRNRAVMAGCDPDVVKTDLARWQGLARDEGLSDGTVAFNDRVGQLIHAELQSTRMACEVKNKALASGRKAHDQTRRDLAHAQRTPVVNEHQQELRVREVNVARDRAAEAEAQVDTIAREMMEVAREMTEPTREPADRKPLSGRARKFREDMVTRKVGHTATEAAVAFKFHRGQQVSCQDQHEY